MVLRVGQGPAPDVRGPRSGDARRVDIDLALTIPMAGAWLAAAVLADGLPVRPTARALRRRATALVFVLGAAVTALVAVAVHEQTVRAVAPVAAASVVVLAFAVPRLNRVRRGAGAFVAAPHVPLPPALRAAAAHPMIGFPVQVTALVSLPAAAVATGLLPATGPTVMGIALTAAVLVAATIGVRLALRHSRLRERAVWVRPQRSPRSVGVVEVERVGIGA